MGVGVVTSSSMTLHTSFRIAQRVISSTQSVWWTSWKTLVMSFFSRWRQRVTTSRMWYMADRTSDPPVVSLSSA